MKSNNNQGVRYKEAERRVRKIKGFYIHLMVYLLVNIFIIGIKTLNIHQGENLWNWDLIQLPLFWGIGLAVHGLSVFLPAFILGKKWEEKKIKELMNKK